MEGLKDKGRAGRIKFAAEVIAAISATLRDAPLQALNLEGSVTLL
jgi:hypothetical protein